MQKEPFFTIITPNYNSDKLLLRAHKSLLSNKTSFEHIIIDDYSDDNSLKYLESYLNNIKIIKNTVNSGPGISRNKGLTIAKGKYVLFLDADDYFVDKALDKLKKIIDSHKDVDCIIFGYQMITNNDDIMKNSKASGIQILNNNELIQKFLLDVIVSSPWAKCIKSSIAKSYKFPNLRVSQDAPYNLDIFMSSKNAVSLMDFLYIFDKTNENSLTRKTFTKKEFLKFYRGWYFFERKAIKNLEINEKNRLISVRKIRFCVFYYMQRLVITPPEQLDKFVIGSIKKIFLKNYSKAFSELSLKHHIIAWIYMFSPKTAFYFIKRFS